MTVKELRVELKKQGLPVSGNKKALVERLAKSKTQINYTYMTVKELRELFSVAADDVYKTRLSKKFILESLS